MNRFTSKTDYLPHLDGLRGLAIIIILIYHSKLFELPGGYLGVDIFFVISGFIITRVLTFELEQQTFRLGQFYLRRVRRLAPALVVVVLLSSGFIWQFLSPAELKYFAWSAISALAMVSNFWFLSAIDYHSVDSVRMPLLHSWSLGVEEQFYLLYPVCLMLLFRLNHRSAGLAIVGMLMISLGLAQWQLAENPQFAFFMLATRAWELLAGAWAYLVLGNRSIQKPWADLIVVTSVIILLVSVTLFNSQSAHPGLLTVVPVLATLGLIVAGNTSKVSMLFFGHPLSRWLGKISYSLYLVHFPLVSVFYLKNPQHSLTLESSLTICFSSITLAALCYYLVEKPLRYSPTQVFVPVTGSAALALLLAALFFVNSDGLKSRDLAVAQVFDGTARQDMHLMKNGERCYVDRSGAGCRFELEQSRKRMINLGDSHGYVMANATKNLAVKLGYDFEATNLTHCPYLPGASRETGFKAKCSLDMQQQLRSYLLSLDPSVLVISVRYPLYFNPEPFYNGEGGVEHTLFFPFQPDAKSEIRSLSAPDLMVAGILELAEHGHEVVLVDVVPEVGWDVPNLIRNRINGHSPTRQLELFRSMAITTNYDVYKERVANTRSVLDRINHENVKRVYPDKLFCSDRTNRCRTHDQQGLFYRDNNHLSQYGARIVANEIELLLASTTK